MESKIWITGANDELKKSPSHTEMNLSQRRQGKNNQTFGMAYNKENYYKKIIKVQEIVKREKYQNGLTQKEIFHQFIADQFNISERTFYNYLAIPAQMKLKKLKRDDNQNQLQLWQ